MLLTRISVKYGSFPCKWSKLGQRHAPRKMFQHSFLFNMSNMSHLIVNGPNKLEVRSQGMVSTPYLFLSVKYGSSHRKWFKLGLRLTPREWSEHSFIFNLSNMCCPFENVLNQVRGPLLGNGLTYFIFNLSNMGHLLENGPSQVRSSLQENGLNLL